MHRNINIATFTLPQGEAPGLLGAEAVPPPGWRGKYPCLSDDFSFDYPKLLNASYSGGVPLAANAKKRVAVIGAGISGTEVARELARCGYQVDLIESSNRVGGRTHSWRAPDGRGGAQLTTYEQGAMRIPFFNRANPTKPGPGPYVGGPFTSGTASCTSCAEFWANQYAISTAAFPDPGKAPGPPIGGRPTFPGVATGIFVNGGFGVDLASLYGEVTELPTKPFMYDWPADSPTLSGWPQSDPNAEGRVTFFNRGEEMQGVAPPPMELGHAIPDSSQFIPPTFGPPSGPDYERNVKAWKLGVTALRTVAYKWTLFASAFLYTIGGKDYTMSVGGKPVAKDGAGWDAVLYDSATWEDFWVNKVMSRYQNVNFYEVAMAGPILPQRQSDGSWKAPAEWRESNFGGLGCNAAEAQVFYTIGAGDGSWGAFFPNSALWALRALLFGFATQHQLILGVLNPEQTAVATGLSPPADTTPQGGARATLKDSAGNAFWAPQYAGVASFAECHLFRPLGAPLGSQSFWDLVQQQQQQCRLLTSSKVTSIVRKGDEAIEVTYVNQAVPGAAPQTAMYNYTVLTVPIWNTQTDMTMSGFPLSSLPMVVPNALSVSNWIRSCKVFVALKEPYWRQGPNDPRNRVFLPQVLATNTELQDMYGLCAPTGADPNPITGGVALISYTWEADAQKFLAYQEKELVQMLLQRLEKVLAAAGLPSFTPFMQDPTLTAPGSFTVWRWSLQPSYHGCAKAYQEGIEQLNYSLLTYNKAHARESNLYMCGDAYSLESGWLEPALRMGLDVVLNLTNNDTTATKTSPGGFNFAKDYQTANPLTMQQSQRTYPLGPPSADELSAKRLRK